MEEAFHGLRFESAENKFFFAFFEKNIGEKKNADLPPEISQVLNHWIETILTSSDPMRRAAGMAELVALNPRFVFSHYPKLKEAFFRLVPDGLPKRFLWELLVHPDLVEIFKKMPSPKKEKVFSGLVNYTKLSGYFLTFDELPFIRDLENSLPADLDNLYLRSLQKMRTYEPGFNPKDSWRGFAALNGKVPQEDLAAFEKLFEAILLRKNLEELRGSLYRKSPVAYASTGWKEPTQVRGLGYNRIQEFQELSGRKIPLYFPSDYPQELISILDRLNLTGVLGSQDLAALPIYLILESKFQKGPCWAADNLLAGSAASREVTLHFLKSGQEGFTLTAALFGQYGHDRSGWIFQKGKHFDLLLEEMQRDPKWRADFLNSAVEGKFNIPMEFLRDFFPWNLKNPMDQLALEKLQAFSIFAEGDLRQFRETIAREGGPLFDEKSFRWKDEGIFREDWLAQEKKLFTGIYLAKIYPELERRGIVVAPTEKPTEKPFDKLCRSIFGFFVRR